MEQSNSKKFQLTDNNIKDIVANWCDGKKEETIQMYGYISDWDTSKVTNMDELFSGKTKFNEDISNWDVSNVTSMYRMFFNAFTYDMPLSKWNVQNVLNMEEMFYGAISFNQFLLRWQVNDKCNLKNIFRCAFTYDKKINFKVVADDYEYSKIKVC